MGGGKEKEPGTGKEPCFPVLLVSNFGHIMEKKNVARRSGSISREEPVVIVEKSDAGSSNEGSDIADPPVVVERRKSKKIRRKRLSSESSLYVTTFRPDFGYISRLFFLAPLGSFSSPPSALFFLPPPHLT